MFDVEKQDQSNAGRQLAEIAIGQIIAANSVRRVTGLPLLDQLTITRLTQYPDRYNYDKACVPCVRSKDGRLQLGASLAEDGKDEIGVRRILKVPLKLVA